ncbi:MAG: ComF family protein [Burkholderiales bacterium]
MLPQDCQLCGAASGSALLCEACAAALPHHIGPCCPICADTTPNGEVCGACLRRPPAFSATTAAFDYDFPLDGLLHAYKYAGNLALAEALALPLVAAVRHGPLPDALLPMPLHPARLKERGFNQALELAKIASAHLDIPLLPSACARIRDTPPQAALAWKERGKNIRQAFVCLDRLDGMRIALVDDVMTTGATLNELAKAARAQGVADVVAWVVARTPPHGDRPRSPHPLTQTD